MAGQVFAYISYKEGKADDTAMPRMSRGGIPASSIASRIRQQQMSQ